MNIKVESLFTPEEIQQEVFNSLKERQLGEKNFYQTPQSVKAWTDLCKSKDYKNHHRSTRCILHHAEKIASRFHPTKTHWVALGCGEATKEIIILKSLKKRQVPFSLLVVDASRVLLEEACETAQNEGIEAVGYHADFTKKSHLQKIMKDVGSGPKVFSILGNTLGAFNQDPLLETITHCMSPDDYLLVDGEIYQEHLTFTGYENPDNRNFIWASLNAVGINKDDGELSLNLEKDPQAQGLHRIKKHFEFKKEKKCEISGQIVDFQTGDILQMPYSYKYTFPAFIRVLTKAKRLEVFSSYFSEDKGYVLSLCRITRL